MDEFNYDFELQYDEDEGEYYGFALANMKVSIGLPSRLQLLMTSIFLLLILVAPIILQVASLEHLTSSNMWARQRANEDGNKSRYEYQKRVWFYGYTITDCYGFEKTTALFKNFKYIPAAQYTMVAINKYMLKGWKLEGDNTMGLRLSKGNKSVTFDLPIYIPRCIICNAC